MVLHLPNALLQLLMSWWLPTIKSFSLLLNWKFAPVNYLIFPTVLGDPCESVVWPRKGPAPHVENCCVIASPEGNIQPNLGLLATALNSTECLWDFWKRWTIMTWLSFHIGLTACVLGVLPGSSRPNKYKPPILLKSAYNKYSVSSATQGYIDTNLQVSWNALEAVVLHLGMHTKQHNTS